MRYGSVSYSSFHYIFPKIFEHFGEIESLVILKSKDSTRHQGLFAIPLSLRYIPLRVGCGFVRFASISDAARSIHELNGKHVVDSVCLHYSPCPNRAIPRLLDRSMLSTLPARQSG